MISLPYNSRRSAEQSADTCRSSRRSKSIQTREPTPFLRNSRTQFFVGWIDTAEYLQFLLLDPSIHIFWSPPAPAALATVTSNTSALRRSSSRVLSGGGAMCAKRNNGRPLCCSPEPCRPALTDKGRHASLESCLGARYA